VSSGGVKVSLERLKDFGEVALSEFALVELYGLLRQPAVMQRVLEASAAAAVCAALRKHPRWRLLGFPADSAALHRVLWEQAGKAGFGRRRIYDARLGLCLVMQGVGEFATVNVRDFEGLGFKRVFNPLA